MNLKFKLFFRVNNQSVLGFRLIDHPCKLASCTGQQLGQITLRTKFHKDLNIQLIQFKGKSYLAFES